MKPSTNTFLKANNMKTPKTPSLPSPLSRVAAKAGVLLILFAVLAAPAVKAANIYWTNAVALSATVPNWTSAAGWLPNGAPSAGNNYFITNAILLGCNTPIGSATFGGDSLTLTNGGVLSLIKNSSGGGSQTESINNFTNNGGQIYLARFATSQNFDFTLDKPAVFLGNCQVQYVAGASGRVTVAFAGGIKGSGTIISSFNGTSAGRQINLSGDNSGYSGNLLFTNINETASVPTGCLALNHSSGWGSGNLTFARTTGTTPEVIFNTIVNASASRMTLIGAQANILANTTLGSLAGTNNAAGTSASVVISSGQTLSFGADNTSTNFWGVVSGAGNLTKVGSGTNTLNGVNTLTGNTTVSSGTLALGASGSIANSAQIILGGGTLDVTAPGSFTVGSSQALILNGGSMEATSLTLDTTTLTNSTTTPSPAVTTTTLNYGGASTVAVAALPGFLSYPQHYSLIKYTSIGSGSYNLSLSSLPAGYYGYLSNNVANTSIDVVLTNGPIPIRTLVWTGVVPDGSAADWDVQTTTNWFNAGAGTFYNLADLAVFNDTATGLYATNVNLTTTLSPGSLTISNNSRAYTFSGTGGLTGGIALVKQGTSSLTIANSGANTFTGGIMGQGGTLLLQAASDAIVGDLTATNGGLVIVDDSAYGTITGNTLVYTNSTVQIGNNDANGSLPSGTVVLANGGSLVFDVQINPEIIGNTISGAGSVVQNNAASVLHFSHINSGFGGATVVNQGTFELDAVGQAGSGPININSNGTLLVNFSTANGNVLARTVANPINGSGIFNINLQNSYPTTLGSVMSGFTGTLNCPAASGSGLVEITSGTVNLNSAATIAIASGGTFYTTVVIPAQIQVAGPGNGANAGALRVDGGGTVSGSVTLLDNSTMGEGTGGTGTISGSIGDGGSAFGISKIGGSGSVLTLSGTNTYTGPTLINVGTLALGATGSIATSTNIAIATGATLDVSAFSLWSLASGQTLSGNGSIKGAVSIAAGSTAAPGDPSTVGTLTVSSNLTLSGVTSLKLNNPANDRLVASNSITYGGTLNVTSIGSDPTVGTTFTLFQAPTLAGSFASVTLPALSDPGLTWLNNLAYNGTITVVYTTSRVLTWTGVVPDGSTGDWDITTTSNWLYSATASSFTNGDLATFDDTAARTAVNLTDTLSPVMLTITNSLKAYTFTGAGGLTGGVTLVKQGTNSLTLANTGTNDFTGVLVQGGTLVLQDTNDAIGGSLTVQLNGTLNFNKTQDQMVNNIVSGAGKVVQSGPNTVTFSGNNTFALTGGVTVNGGVLDLDTPNFNTFHGSGVFINNGSTFRVSTSGGNNRYDFGGVNITFDANGGGIMDVTDGGVNFVFANTNTFVTSGGAPDLIVGASGLNLNSKTAFFNVARGSGASDLQVASYIWNTGTVFKTGNGILELTTNNTYTGPTIVNAGTLLVDGDGQIPNASLLTVLTNATLGGSGTVSGIAAINAGGTVLGGDANYTNVLNVVTELDLGTATNAVTYSKFRIATGGHIAATTLKVTGTNIVTILDASLTVGTNTLFNYLTLGGTNGFAGFKLGALPAGVTANLLDTGSAVQLAVTAAAPPIATNPTNIVTTVSGGNLNLAWPADHTGWRLLVQTNNLAAGVSSNTNDWMTVIGSAATNQMSIPMDAAKPTEFFRLVYP